MSATASCARRSCAVNQSKRMNAMGNILLAIAGLAIAFLMLLEIDADN